MEQQQSRDRDTKMWEQVLRPSQNALDGNSVFSVDESRARSQFLKIFLVFVLKRKALALTNFMIAPSSHRNPHGCARSESAARTRLHDRNMIISSCSSHALSLPVCVFLLRSCGGRAQKHGTAERLFPGAARSLVDVAPPASRLTGLPAALRPPG